ncbi:MAG: hypothetical protein AB1Z98_32480 [Nannocystaceae bacterium]
MAPVDEVEARFMELLERHFGFVGRYGYGAVERHHDRAERRIVLHKDPARITTGFFGQWPIRSVSIALVPGRPVQPFSLDQAIAALDPERHASLPEHPTEMSEAQLEAWMKPRAELFHAHAQALLEQPEAVFARVRAAAPLGEQCKAFVARCREAFALEDRHGYAPPETIHWRHECEVTFRKGSLRLHVTLEDHEDQGIAEPLTVPTLVLYDDDADLTLPLDAAIARLDPEHHARRPVAATYAMRLELLQPFIDYYAAFIASHPQLFEGGAALRALA